MENPPGEHGMTMSVEFDIFALPCFDTLSWATGMAFRL